MNRKAVASAPSLAGPTPAQSPAPSYQRHQSLPEGHGTPLQQYLQPYSQSPYQQTLLPYRQPQIPYQQSQSLYQALDHRSLSAPAPGQQIQYYKGQPQYQVYQGYQQLNGVAYVPSPIPMVDQNGKHHPQAQTQQHAGATAGANVVIVQEQKSSGCCGACLGGCCGGCCGSCAACCCCGCTVM